MSQENVEIVKANIDAYTRGDWDAFFKDVAPSFELDMSRSIGPWRGIFKLDQARRLLEEFRETWESARWEPHEFIEAGDLVVVPVTQHMKGVAGSRWLFVPPGCGQSATEQSSGSRCTKSGRTHSKPWASRSKTFTPTPEAAPKRL
jgi:hypothetical protein